MGELAFWLAAIAALSLTILALARPQGITSIVRSPGADIVLLMDGSASMRVTDMGTDRWQRAMTWVRTLTQTLAWDGDRLALATFADIAVPQIRLTRDPNTILFFLDHLDKQPTFKLEDDTTWDTNAEDAILLGHEARRYRPGDVRAEQERQDLRASSRTGRSGAATCSARSSRPSTRDHGGRDWRGHIAGGTIPLPRGEDGKVLGGSSPSIRRSIAPRCGRSRARATASTSSSTPRPTRRSPRESSRAPPGVRATSRLDQSFDELYWYALVAAAACLGLGLLFIRQKVQLGLQLAVALGLLAMIASLRQ